jgi:ABC-2 type transport system ATP-binding protein
LLTGMLRRDGGHIKVLGWDPEAQAREVRRCIGYVPQETNVYLDLNAMDNLWQHAALYCDELAGVQERIQTLLSLMDLWDRRKDAVRTYSGGMKRRLVLARALLHDPQVILFDEPTLGVDVQARHVLWEHVRAQQSQGKTFIISTNYMEEADALCDRLVIIDRGRVIARGAPEQLKSDLGRDSITLRTSPPIEDPETLFEGLAVQSVTRPRRDTIRLEIRGAELVVGELVRRVTEEHRLESMRVARPTLDDVFLHHTGRGLRE